MNKKLIGATLCSYLLPLCFSAQAQQPKTFRIGFLAAGPRASVTSRIEAFRAGLRELGYVEGKNLVIEERYGDAKIERVPELAAELVRLKIDVIVTGGSQATGPAKKATSTIPIVMAQDNDPVGSGFVASLAQPGGNITGLANLNSELSGKQLEVLKESFPKLRRVAILSDMSEPGSHQSVKETELAAKALGVEPHYLDIRALKDFDGALISARAKKVDALLVLPSALFNSHRKPLVELAAKLKLPAMYPRADYVDDGGLMTYGVDTNDLLRRAAIFVDKILKGAKPAVIPVEQPEKFDFIVNLKTAKQLGVTIPPNVLVRASRVIK
jgi:putative ABC transport system substrate-binding protein